MEELVKDWPAHTRSAAELEYVRRLFQGIAHSQDPDTEVATLLHPALAACTKELVDAGMKLIEDVVTEEELSDKFCTEKGKELIFGGLDSFNAGLEAVVGPPNPDLWGAIRKEHTDSADSWAFFTTTNYGVKTKPAYEYWFVVDSIKGKEEIAKHEEGSGHWGGAYPVEELEKLPQRKQRFAVPLESFETSLAAINAQLRRALIKPLRLEELMCCRLYTGPMFMKFNVVMRGASAVPGKLLGKPQWAVDKFKEECRGNKYSTTISAVNSAIIKLSKQTTVNKVYRGVSGFGLPKILTTKNEHNVIGGVEFAFLSTTLDRNVAMKYARGHSDPSSGFGVVLEITPGLLGRGADLSWVSQYPFEQVILFPPLTALEFYDRRIQDQVIVISVRPTTLAMACAHDMALPELLDSPSCEIERTDDAKHTPLMLCCLAGNEEEVDMLLIKGAKASARGPDGKTALMLAAAAGHSGAVKLLVTDTKSKSTAEAQALIEQRDELGRTALMHGAAAGHSATARALLLAGANRSVKSSVGRQTALMTAFAEVTLTLALALTLTQAAFRPAPRPASYALLSMSTYPTPSPSL